jgi:hypothetical protein
LFARYLFTYLRREKGRVETDIEDKGNVEVWNGLMWFRAFGTP